MTAPNRFQQLEADYFVLRGKFVAGRITRDEFSTALKERLIKDDRGAYWTIGADNGKWFRYDGVRWLEASPPGGTAPNAMGQPVPPPPRGGQPTPLPVVSNPAAQKPLSQPVVAAPPQVQVVHPSKPALTPPQVARPSQPVSVPPRTATTAAPAAGSSAVPRVSGNSSTAASPLAHWVAAVRAMGWRGLLPLAFVLIYVLLTRNVMPLIIGGVIAIGVRVLSAPADRVLAPLWPVRNLIPRRPRMVLAWVVPLAVSLLISTVLYNFFAWLPLIGPEASVFAFTAAIAATIAFVLVREPAQQAAAR